MFDRIDYAFPVISYSLASLLKKGLTMSAITTAARFSENICEKHPRFVQNEQGEIRTPAKVVISPEFFPAKLPIFFTCTL